MTEEQSGNGAGNGAAGSPAIPVIPDELEIDPLLAALLHCAAFLDLSDEDVVEPDAAHAVLEHVGLYVQRLPPDRIAEIERQLERVKAHGEQVGWPDWVVAFVSDFLYSCGIGEDADEPE